MWATADGEGNQPKYKSEASLLADRIEAQAEVVLYDHELRSEYLTDKERNLIIMALRK